jgi:hypothetical protein
MMTRILNSRRLLNAAYGAVGAMAMALALPVAASAHRPAVRGEKAAMIYNANARYYGGRNENEPRLGAVPLLRGRYCDCSQRLPMGGVVV